MAIFHTGNSGLSSGPHLDLRVYNPATGQYENPSGYTSYLTVGDNPFDFEITSGFQPDGRVHPETGELKPHLGIDYATPSGTQLSVNGQLMSTWKDQDGGIMSQYLINTDDGHRELLLLHGSDKNPITGTGALTDYDPTSFLAVSVAPDSTTPTTARQEAVERVQNYANMTKAELDAAYDAMRNDPVKAREEGMKMHKAYFGKS